MWLSNYDCIVNLYIYNFHLSVLMIMPFFKKRKEIGTPVNSLNYFLASWSEIEKCSWGIIPFQAVALDPNFLDAYINLGNVLKEARIFDRWKFFVRLN